MKIAIDEEQKSHERLDSENSLLIRKINFHSSKADLYNELEVAGFGIIEQRRLLVTINNIAMSNRMG